MNRERLLTLILDSWNKPVVFVDSEHIIQYMNQPAKINYAKWGDVTGKSIFDCHNKDSCRIIKEIYIQLENGAEEIMFKDSIKHRVYIRAVRDENGNLIGYYERYEPPVVK
jgi:DUF438 domain-containing protein